MTRKPLSFFILGTWGLDRQMSLAGTSVTYTQVKKKKKNKGTGENSSYIERHKWGILNLEIDLFFPMESQWKYKAPNQQSRGQDSLSL